MAYIEPTVRRLAATLYCPPRTHGHDMVQSDLDWQAISSQTQGLGSTTGHFMVQTAASLCLKRHAAPARSSGSTSYEI
jgi:hypothetical protein